LAVSVGQLAALRRDASLESIDDQTTQAWERRAVILRGEKGRERSPQLKIPLGRPDGKIKALVAKRR